MAPIQGVKRQSLSTSEAVSEPPIQGSTIIVIHPGSYNLRIGRASDSFPHSIPHVIARRCNPTSSTRLHNDPTLVATLQDPTREQQAVNSMLYTQKSVSGLLQTCLTSSGGRRYATPPEQVANLNSSSSPEVQDGTTALQWTKVDPGRDYLVGEEVLYMNPKETFSVHWPIRRGQFNLHSGIGGSITAVMADLEVIWTHAIQSRLDIPKKDLRHYRAVLVIPDLYNRHHLKYLSNLLLNKLGFSAFFLHQESVCATFGAGVSYACVVDVGDQKTSISCVEDGISHRPSRLCLNFGGSDVTRVLFWLLKRCGFPYRECDPRRRTDAILLHDLKESLCHINLNCCGIQKRLFQVKVPERPILQYSLHVGDECLLAPLALFYPDMFALTAPPLTLLQQRSQGDSEDPHDENYLRETSQRRGPRESSDQGNQPGDSAPLDDTTPALLDDDVDVPDPVEPSRAAKDVEREVASWDHLLSIDQAILQSIDHCGSDEMKRKMYSCILIVGGGMMFQGTETWLHNRLAMQVPILYRSEQMDIVTRPRDTDPRITSWRGAAVMSLLDTAQELWIRPKEWGKYGVRVLRERAPFIW